MRRLMVILALALGVLTLVTGPADARCRYADGSYGPCPRIGR